MTREEGKGKLHARSFSAINDSGRTAQPAPPSTKRTMLVHYIQLRSANGTQEEHREIAVAARAIFAAALPRTAEALGWNAEELKI